MKEAENWKGLPLEARKETKNILRNDILERYLEIKNTGFNSIKKVWKQGATRDSALRWKNQLGSLKSIL